MQVTISGKNLTVSEALKDHVQKKLAKIGSRFDNIVTANVTMSTDRKRQIVEVTLFGKGFDMRAEERDCDDMYSSLNTVVDRLEKQLSRTRERSLDMTRKTRDTEAVADVKADPNAAPVKAGVKIDRISSYNAAPMTLEEAIKVLEEKGHVFYTFHNAENGRINVVYVTERGFGLIDPKI